MCSRSAPAAEPGGWPPRGASYGCRRDRFPPACATRPEAETAAPEPRTTFCDETRRLLRPTGRRPPGARHPGPQSPPWPTRLVRRPRSLDLSDGRLGGPGRLRLDDVFDDEG